MSALEPALTDPDSTLFRHVLGHYPTGVAIVTGSSSGTDIGMSLNSFTAVSLNPPLVLFCPALSSTTWPLLRDVGLLGINVLSANQAWVSRAFAGPGPDRFADVRRTAGKNGAPLLSDALGWMECAVASEYPAGDHTIVLAEIQRLGIHPDIQDPLLFFRSRYYSGVAEALQSEVRTTIEGQLNEA